MKTQLLTVGALILLVSGCADTPTLPPATALTPGEAAAARGAVTPRQAAPEPTIVDVALAVNAESGEFSTLIAAVLAADLATELSARGQRTVFAPTDAAFAKLGLDAASVVTLPMDALEEILLYHVIPGRRESGSLATTTRVRTAGGGFASIRTENGTTMINDAMVIGVDVPASNGMIHIIDTVLMP